MSNIQQVSLGATVSQLPQSLVSKNTGHISTERYNQSQHKVAETTSEVQYQTEQRINHPEERRHQRQEPLMSHMQSRIALPPGPTPVRYAHSDAHVLPPTHQLASSTVSFMTRPQEILNVIQPRLDSFYQSQLQPVRNQHVGQYVHSDTCLLYTSPSPRD